MTLDIWYDISLLDRRNKLHKEREVCSGAHSLFVEVQKVIELSWRHFVGTGKLSFSLM